MLTRMNRSAARLDERTIQARLSQIPGWKVHQRTLVRTYRFPSFADALFFVNHAGFLAEQADHHPDILIRYKEVVLTLSTHSEGGVTQKDFDLARRIDGF